MTRNPGHMQLGWIWKYCTLEGNLLLNLPTRRKLRLIEGNAKCRHLNKLICKGTLRQVFICLRPRTPEAPIYPPPPQPLHTVYVHTVYSILIHTGKGGGVLTRGATVHKAGSKIPDWLCLQPINSDTHLPQSPFTGKFIWMATFCFGVYIVN